MFVIYRGSGRRWRSTRQDDLEQLEETDLLPSGGFATLVPEFAVLDLAACFRLWCDVPGFRVAYHDLSRALPIWSARVCK